MSAIPKLAERFQEIDHVLEVLREMEKRQRSNRASSFQKNRLIAATRASVYIMIYNAIEAALREVMYGMRSKIQSEGVGFSDISEFWRLDLIQSKFLHRMASGTNHGNLLVGLVPMTSTSLEWADDDIERLPFSGNFGQGSAFRLLKQLGIGWSAPAASFGGVDLENIRLRRNALAHGLETFQEAGSQVTATTLVDVLKRVRVFMLSYVAAIESYASQQEYLTPYALPPGTVANLEESPGSFEEVQPQTDG